MDHHSHEAHDIDGFMNNKCSSKQCPDKCSMAWKIHQENQRNQGVNSSLDGHFWLENDKFDIICKGLSLHMIRQGYLHF